MYLQQTSYGKETESTLGNEKEVLIFLPRLLLLFPVIIGTREWRGRENDKTKLWNSRIEWDEIFSWVCREWETPTRKYGPFKKSRTSFSWKIIEREGEQRNSGVELSLDVCLEYTV